MPFPLHFSQLFCDLMFLHTQGKREERKKERMKEKKEETPKTNIHEQINIKV
jgi:hypothetical protein